MFKECGWRTTEAYLSNEPKGSGELKSNQKIAFEGRSEQKAYVVMFHRLK